MQVIELDGKKLARKTFLAVRVTCMAIYSPTPGFKVKTFKLCVLNRWDFNFCVRSSPLWGKKKENLLIPKLVSSIGKTEPDQEIFE